MISARIVCVTFAALTLLACGDGGGAAASATAKSSASAKASAAAAPTSKASAAASATAAAPPSDGDEQLTEADFEEAADKEIGLDNLDTELAALEKELAEDR
jgi:hypothetical protein